MVKVMYSGLKMLETITTEAIVFLSWFFFQEHLEFIGQQGKREAISLTPLYHFHLLHRHLDVCQVITAERSLLQ